MLPEHLSAIGLIPLVVATTVGSAQTTTAGWPFVAGSATAALVVTEDFNLTVSIGRTTLELVGAGVALRCGGQRYEHGVGTTSSPSVGCETENNTAWSGTEIGHELGAISAEECCAACKRLPGCAYWNWNWFAPSSGCYFKAADAASTRHPLRGVSSGRNPTAPAHPPARPLSREDSAFQSNGTDERRGPWTQVSQKWAAERCTRVTTAITYYSDLDAFEFAMDWDEGGATETAFQAPARASASLSLSSEWPAFKVKAGPTTAVGMLTWTGDFLSGSERVTPPTSLNNVLSTWQGGMDGGPLVLFDGASDASLTLGVTSHFTTGALAKRGNQQIERGCDGAVMGGLNGYVASVPGGFKATFGLAARAEGVNAAVHAWGELVRAQHGTDGSTGRLTLKDDILSRQLSYFQDNGAYYCFCEWALRYLNKRSGYTRSADILKSLRQYHMDIGLDVGVYHIDPYWASQGTNSSFDNTPAGGAAMCCGGCKTGFVTNMSASPWHFPGGVHASVGTDQRLMLFIAHMWSEAKDVVYSKTWPWIDGGDTSEQATHDTHSTIAPASSAAFWSEIVDGLVNTSNLAAATVDQLNGPQYAFKAITNTTDGYELIQGGLAAAMANRKIPYRVDQHTPPLAMSSVHQPAWVTSRCGGDADPNTGSSPRSKIIGASLLLSSLKLRPMMDVLWTSTVESEDPYTTKCCGPAHGAPSSANSRRTDLQKDLVIAALSTGPIGIGDKIGSTNVSLLMSVLRKDAVILKPAHPLYKLQRCYDSSDSAGQVWVAPSVPARSRSSATDRRANSLARLTPRGLRKERDGALWWWSFLAMLSNKSLTVPISDLWPHVSQTSSFYVVRSRFGFGQAGPTPARCMNGSAADECLAFVSARVPMHIAGNSLPSDSAGNETLPYRLYQFAPVLTSGWALLGETNKVVHVSPQRFLSAPHARLAKSGRMQTLEDGRTTDDGSSDAAVADEFVTPSGELSFGLIGAALEQVEVAIVTPNPMNVVLLLPVQLGVEGSAEVLCHSNGVDVSCSYPSYKN